MDEASGGGVTEEKTSSATKSEEEQRRKLYEQFEVSWADDLAIRHILPRLDEHVQARSRYDVSSRSRVLAEISLLQAYKREPKFRIFAWGVALIGVYDCLHYLNPAFYGLLLGALATLNGFVSSLRSPAMMAAELEGATDEDGMPADYRATAHSSANTNVTLVLFVLALGVQLLITSSIVQGEIIARNIAEGTLPVAVSVLVLVSIPLVKDRLRRNDDES